MYPSIALLRTWLISIVFPKESSGPILLLTISFKYPSGQTQVSSILDLKTNRFLKNPLAAGQPKILSLSSDMLFFKK